MRRKLVLVAVAVVALVVATSVLVGWRASTVPSWYAAQERGESEDRPEEAGSLAGSLGSLLGIDVGGAAQAGLVVQRLLRDGRVEVDAAQLVDLVRTGLSGSRDGRIFLEAAGALRARIADGTVEVGALVDLPRLRADEIDPDVGEVIGTLRSWIPWLVSDERYVGLRGRPAAVDGDLGLEEGARLQVGSLGLPLGLLVADTADDPLRRRLALDLQVLRVTRAAVEGDRLVIEASPGPSR